MNSGSADRFRRADAIFDAALDLPDGEQAGFVDQACGDDFELRGEVHRLLQAHRYSDGFLGSPALDLAVPLLQDTELGPTGPWPERIGPFRIVSELGHGGMGTVYLGERDDGQFEQRAALKLIRRIEEGQGTVRRFLEERRILALLEHPRIARLLDGGISAEGQPYFAMELVEGEPIDRFCDARGLTVEGRLELFLAVCDAVQYAHQHLVVHRDLKPSNILVTGDGQIKLLDFGIAKLLDQGGEHTQGGLRALTPDYASPEQLRGEPITTAADIYQLGLLLRELVTGVRPLAGDTHPGEPPLRPSRAAGQALRAAEPPEVRAGARATSPERLAKQLRGDLDIIVGKALRPDPAHRYASADELAGDIRRHLKGLPILAHPESAAYRMRKFARRHAWTVGAGALSLALLAAYAITVTVQGRRIAAAGARAEQEAQAAEQVTEFMVQLFQSGDPTVALSDTVTVSGILEEGARRIDTALASEPAVRARLLLAIGRAFTGLGRYDRADTLLSRAVELEREAHGPDHPRVADVLNAVGLNFKTSRGFREADRAFHEEFRIRIAGVTIADTARARMLQALSETRRDNGDVDSAVVLIREAVRLRRSAGDSLSPEYIEALGILAYVLRAAGALDSAETIYREVLRRRIDRVGRDDYSLATVYNNLGFLLRTREDYGAAEAEYREAVRISRKVLGEGHPTSLMFASNLAGSLELQGKFEAAEAIVRERAAAALRQWPEGHWRAGAAQETLGKFLLRRGRPGEALAPLEATVANYRETIGPDHPWTALARVWQGIALLQLRRSAQAGRLLTPSIALLQAKKADLATDFRLEVGKAADMLVSHGDQARAALLRAVLAPADSGRGTP